MTSRHSFASRMRAFMDRACAPSRRLSQGQVELSGMRVLQQLRREPQWQSATPVVSDETSALRRKAQARWVAAAATVALAVGGAIVWRQADTALYRVVEGDVRAGDLPSLLGSFRLRAGATAGQVGGTGTIRTNGSGAGAVLALADGSRVEMRSHSELSVERADDGLRIRLSSGGIIVNAAKQRDGHLYVQTKDMTVSVVGTVFVVNADENGSRVAVVEG